MSFLNFINIDYINEKDYLKKSFDKAFKILSVNKAQGLINLPLNKKKFLGNDFPGITEFISKTFNTSGKETMLLYNEEFSVSPITTHIKLKEVSNSINQKKILNNINNINNFYKKIIGIKKPKIALLGLNPHCGIDFFKKTEEEEIIKPAIKKIRKKNLNVIGPISADTAFFNVKNKKINSIIGLYHDQVLPTFKFAHNFNAINITLGIPFLRISPDHGTAIDLIGSNKVDPGSFLYALNFFEKYHQKI